MGRKKTIQNIPKSTLLKCPFCEKKTKALISIDNCPQKFTCPKCNAEVRNPITQCCIICAFSNKKCPRTLYMNAKVKGLEIRGLDNLE
jgi:predicted nucleic acid-binding Zn ribbon protein